MKHDIKRSVLVLSAGTVVMLASAGAFAEQVSCHATKQEEVAALFDRWNASLATGNPAAVDANYAPDAVLLPTLSSEIRTTSKARVDYFAHLLTHKPSAHIDFREIKIDCNTAIDTGNYTLSFEDGSKVAARYTFTYRWHDGKWLISSHHSSRKPEGL